jgi:murein DD-endopeptidase MepM/ murein hydrolase activator NlpD
MWSYGAPRSYEERKKMKEPERGPMTEEEQAAYDLALAEAREAREALEKVHRETNPRGGIVLQSVVFRADDKKAKFYEPYCFPLVFRVRVPVAPHPGSFGAIRKYDRHTGVDLYIPEEFSGAKVFAIEAGRVVKVIQFTGQHSSPPTPYWHDTQAVLVEGDSGVILYGEIVSEVQEGDYVHAGADLGYTTPVLKTDKGRPIEMLHVELLSKGSRSEASVWEKDQNFPCEGVYDPTFLLIQGLVKK